MDERVNDSLSTQITTICLISRPMKSGPASTPTQHSTAQHAISQEIVTIIIIIIIIII
jgi:hypothetical protein